jgi:type IV secretory pathway VirB10-like protein
MFGASFFTAWLADRVTPTNQSSGFGGVTTTVSPAGQVLVDTSRTILDRNKGIRPTITVAKGARINIEVKKDMEFAGPYDRRSN